MAMSWDEAVVILQGYLETYVIPSAEVEDAIQVGILACTRCNFLDDQAEKRKKMNVDQKIEKCLTPEEVKLKQELKDIMNS
jgi:hypothetical protein